MGFLTWGGSTHTMEEGGVPATIADTLTIYSKDVGGRTELFVKDSAGTEVQMTSAGAIVGPAIAGDDDDIQVKDGTNFAAPGPAINSSAQLLMGDGVVGAPSIAGASHADTGIAWDIGSSGDLDLVVDGVLNMRLKNNHTSLLQPTIPLQGTPAAPGLCLGNSFSAGIHSGSTSNFGTATGGIKAGWRITGIGGGQGAVHFQDHQTSPATCCSLSGGYDTSTFDFDTGVSFHAGGDNTVSNFSNGVERTRWGSSGEVITAPALANSTGSVSDTGAVQTTDATQTTLHTLSLADNTTYAVSVTVAGRDTAGTERCSYIRYVQAHRQGGGGATISAITTPFSVESDAGLDCTYTVSGNDLRVSITGKAGTTINWSASINYIGSE